MRKSWIVPGCIGLAIAVAVGASPPKHTGKKPPVKKPESGKVVTTKSGLKYIDLKVGKGAAPRFGELVTVNYEGKLANGTVFDATYKHTDPQHPHGEPFQFNLGGRVIPAWNEGVATMRVGGKRKLICPPGLAYGPDGSPPAIPPNATLTFVVEVLKVGP